MARQNTFKVRLTDEELGWLQAYAESKQITTALRSETIYPKTQTKRKVALKCEACIPLFPVIN